jgi:hypothetical protein
MTILGQLEVLQVGRMTAYLLYDASIMQTGRMTEKNLFLCT